MADRRGRRSLHFLILIQRLAVLGEQGQLLQIHQIRAVGGLTLGQDGGAAAYGTACRLHQLLQGVHGVAQGDHVVHDEDALALHEGGVVAVQVEVLLAVGGDGVNLDVQDVSHVQLGPLAGQHILLVARQARHLVDQGDTLGLGGDHVVVLGDLGEEGFGTGGGQLGVAEDDEGADHEVLGQGTEGEGAVTARNSHVVVHLFHVSFPF